MTVMITFAMPITVPFLDWMRWTLFRNGQVNTSLISSEMVLKVLKVERECGSIGSALHKPCLVSLVAGKQPFSIHTNDALLNLFCLSAIFVILQNDGDDYFCNANNRAIPRMDEMDLVPKWTGQYVIDLE
jgi:hypothetical protein